MLDSHPYHARLLKTIVHTGPWADYEAWKTMLVKRVEHHRHEGLTVVLHDFGAYHGYAAEPVPSSGAGPLPRWYWESGHFRAELGARMLAIMTGQAAPDGLCGVELRSQILRAHVEDVRTSRRAFASAQPDAVAEMLRIVARACLPAPGRDCARERELGRWPARE